MTTNAEQEAINQARANRNGGGKKQAKSVIDKEAGVSNIQAHLDKARNDVRRSTKAYVLGGITDAISDISRGDFGDVGEQIFGQLEGFSSSVIELETESRFQLPPATDPKKMLSASVVDAAVVN